MDTIDIIDRRAGRTDSRRSSGLRTGWRVILCALRPRRPLWWPSGFSPRSRCPIPNRCLAFLGRLASNELPSGSVSVRVIRGSLTNNIAGQPVELHVGDKVQTAKTDEEGRAQFDKLPAGASLKAVTVVDGERLESQVFPAPAHGRHPR